MSQKEGFLFGRQTAAKFGLLFVMFRIEAIVTQHFKMLFGDVNDETFYKIKNRETFRNRLIIFVSSVMKGNGITIVAINTRGSDNRSTEISADIFDGDVGSAEIGFSTDIESIGMMIINIIFDFAERRPYSLGHLVQKNFAESIAKESVIKMFNGAPGREIAGTTFRNKAMDMRVPFEIASEGMEDANKAGSEVFRLIYVVEHAENDISDGMKEAI